MNRSTTIEEDTIIGSHNFLMQHCHVAHNCRLGDHVILASGAMLGGHAAVADRAFISGNCLVHQFVRVGTLAMMQGGSALSKDLPPFCVVHDTNRLCGLNVVGLRRAGLAAADRLELRKLYHALFRSGGRFHEAIAAAKEQFKGEPARVLLEFCETAKRSVLRGHGNRSDRESE